MPKKKQEKQPVVVFSDLIRQQTAARLLGITRQGIHDHVRKGRLQVFLIDNLPFVSRTEIEAIRNERLTQ